MFVEAPRAEPFRRPGRRGSTVNCQRGQPEAEAARPRRMKLIQGRIGLHDDGIVIRVEAIAAEAEEPPGGQDEAEEARRRIDLRTARADGGRSSSPARASTNASSTASRSTRADSGLKDNLRTDD